MNLPSIPKSFFNGDCFDAYRILGAHPWQGDHGEEGWRFAVWAPGATAVEALTAGAQASRSRKPTPACGAALYPGCARGSSTNTASTGPTAAWSCGPTPTLSRPKSAPPTPAA